MDLVEWLLFLLIGQWGFLLRLRCVSSSQRPTCFYAPANDLGTHNYHTIRNICRLDNKQSFFDIFIPVLSTMDQSPTPHYAPVNQFTFEGFSNTSRPYRFTILNNTLFSRLSNKYIACPLICAIWTNRKKKPKCETLYGLLLLLVHRIRAAGVGFSESSLVTLPTKPWEGVIWISNHLLTK